MSKNLKVIVTGGAGFIGSHMVDLLLKKKFKVIVLDNFTGGHKKNLHQKFYFDSLKEPLIIIPFLSKAAKKNLIYFQLDSAEIKLSITPSDILSLSNNVIPHTISKFSISLTVERQTLYSAETWNSLYNLSLDTFVEESEEKKLSGAGAGLTDND